jgi:hypothetical protein
MMNGRWNDNMKINFRVVSCEDQNGRTSAEASLSATGKLIAYD